MSKKTVYFKSKQSSKCYELPLNVIRLWIVFILYVMGNVPDRWRSNSLFSKLLPNLWSKILFACFLYSVRRETGIMLRLKLHYLVDDCFCTKWWKLFESVRTYGLNSVCLFHGFICPWTNLSKPERSSLRIFTSLWHRRGYLQWRA
jgi:hypothetical protein